MSRSAFRLGPVSGTALYLGAVLGPGVLALPSLAARAAGPASLLSWLFLLCASVPVALTFAALGARLPDGGGVAVSVARAFGRHAAAPVGWWFLAAVPVGTLAAALIGGAYVAHAVGGGDATAAVAAAALLAAAFAANQAGLRVSGRVQLVLAGLLVLLLVAAVALNLPHLDGGNLTPFAPHGWAAVGGAASVLFFAFAGWEAASHLSAEFADPRRHLRVVTWWTLGIVGALYLGLAVASVGVLGAAGAASDVPLLLLMERAVGGAAPVLTAGAAVLLTFGAISTYIAGAGRLAAALGRDGGLPRWFDDGTRPGDTPRRGPAVLAVCCAVLGAAAIVFGLDLDALMRATSACLAAVTFAGTAAAVRLLGDRPALRAGAVLAAAFTAVVLVFSGVLVLIPVVLGAAALGYALAGARRPRTPDAAAGVG